MLSQIEKGIAKEVYSRTSSIDLATFAVTIRRLFPKLVMETHNLPSLIGDTSDEIELLISRDK